MSRSSPNLSPEVKALVEAERSIQPLPAAVRARAMTRAQAALVAGGVTHSALPGPAWRIHWAAVAAVMCLVSAVVGAAAYEIRARFANQSHPVATVAVTTPPAPTPVAATTAEPAPEAVTAESSSTPAGSIAAPTPSADAAQAELRLLRRARAAVAQGDFAAALPLIAEHARRFQNGRLAEEREALRVKALLGLGRTDAARRAAAAFETRFPHSVLLPSVRKMAAPGP